MFGRPFVRVAAVSLLPVALCFLVSCGGSDTAPPVCSLSVASLDFDTLAVGGSAERDFRIINHGSGRLAGRVATGCGAYRVIGPATYDLGAGEWAAFTIRCTPTTQGSTRCNVSLGTSGCGPLPCAAFAVPWAPAECRVSPDSLDFGAVTVGSRVERTFTVTNSGVATLAGTIGLDGACRSFRLVGGTAYSLGAGHSATFTVSFEPDSLGPQACAVRLTGGCSRVALAGLGSGPTIAGYVELFGDMSYNSNLTSDLGLLVLSPLGLGDLGCGPSLYLMAGLQDTTGFLLLGCRDCLGLRMGSTLTRVDIELHNVTSSGWSEGLALHAIAGLCDERMPLTAASETQCEASSVSLSGPGLNFRTDGTLAVGLGLKDRAYTPTFPGHRVGFTYARFTFQGVNVPIGAPVRQGRLKGLSPLPVAGLLSKPAR